MVRVPGDAVSVERQDLRVSYAYVRWADRGSGHGHMTHRCDLVVYDVRSHDFSNGSVVPLGREVILKVTSVEVVSMECINTI